MFCYDMKNSLHSYSSNLLTYLGKGALTSADYVLPRVRTCNVFTLEFSVAMRMYRKQYVFRGYMNDSFLCSIHTIKCFVLFCFTF